MNSCTILYIGDGKIATNAYNLSESQKIKRQVLQLGPCDVLSLNAMFDICNEHKDVVIYNLIESMTDDTFLFNYIAEHGLDLRALGTKPGAKKIIFSPGVPAIYDWHYNIIFSNFNFTPKYYFNTASRLITVALESLHDFYWRTNKFKYWSYILRQNQEELHKLKDKIEREYSMDITDFAYRQRFKGEYREIQRKVRNLLSGYNVGFKATVKADMISTSLSNAIFEFYVEDGDERYWKLDNGYYIINLNGIEYGLRYVGETTINDIIRLSGLSSIRDISTKSGRARVVSAIFNEKNKLRPIKVANELKINDMILGLVREVYNIASDIRLYNCSQSCISFAVPSRINHKEIIYVIQKILRDTWLWHCFDSITIGDKSNNLYIDSLCEYNDTKYRFIEHYDASGIELFE